MFKVQENSDGSTSIFCSFSGQLICTIEQQKSKSDIKFEKQNGKFFGKVPSNSHQKPSLDNDLDIEEKQLKHETRESKASITPQSILLEEESEDYFDDCINSDQFARCLDLIPKEKLDNEDIGKLKTKYPLRYLSRTRLSEVTDELKDLKLPDDMPLTSHLGVKMLHLNPQKNFISDQVAQIAIKKYDSFCRFALNTLELIGANFPKLRCREIKEYPICTSSKVMKVTNTHTYTFTRQQRVENLITMKTGLDKRSRRLQHLCNKKRLCISIKRLTDKEIASWKKRKSHSFLSTKASSLITNTVYIDSETTSDSDSSSVTTSDSDTSAAPFDPNFSARISVHNFLPKNTPKRSLTWRNSDFYSKQNSGKYVKSNRRQSGYSSERAHSNFNCYIKLHNILQLIYKKGETYYVRGSSIRIPFYKEYLNTLRSKNVSKKKNGKMNLNLSNLRKDHPYHIPFVKQTCNTKSLCDLNKSYCTNTSKTEKNVLKNLKTNMMKKLPRSSPLFGNSTSSSALAERSLNTEHIPVIDLTQDCASVPGNTTVPDSVIMDKRISHWIFRCFGCGYNCEFISNSLVDTAVNEHMQIYHSVSNPDSFLSFDTDKNCVVIEAFPGFKTGM